MDFTPLQWNTDRDLLRANERMTVSYRIGASTVMDDYGMLAMGTDELRGMARERMSVAMAERMITDAIGLINPDGQDVMVTHHMPEVMLIHPKLYSELLGSLSMNDMSDRWFPPRRI